MRAESARRYYPSTGRGFGKAKPIRAVDGVSFSIGTSETLSLVGESGCGKSTIAKLMLRLERPTHGQIFFQGQDIAHLNDNQEVHYRRSVQAVFQDPLSSLNPRMRIRGIVSEPLEILGALNRHERSERVGQSLEAVGIDPSLQASFPHEFSGGMRQRIAVARAIVSSPKLIVLDEPVSALDVSVGAQIMNLLRDLQENLGIAYLLIAHNLATVRYLSRRVAVLYLGRIVEMGDAGELLRNPRHPYTAALISASLSSHPADLRERIVLEGEVPSPIHPPTGCPFHPRCWLYKALDAPAICRSERPEMRSIGEHQLVSCHFAESMPN